MKTAIALGCLTLFLTACNSAAPIPTAILVNSPEKPVTTFTGAPPESNTRQPRPTLTRTPTNTPLPVPTLKPPTPTVAPSPTLAPTLTADQEQALVLDLLQNNGGCKLPCWWGFMPGKTDWQTAQNFFASLGKIPGEYRDPDMLNYSVSFFIPEHAVQSGQVYIVKDGVVDAIRVRAGTIRNHETIYGDSQFAEDWQRPEMDAYDAL
jgi:hypothetical protein